MTPTLPDLRGLTLAERILSVRAGVRVRAGELVVVEVDQVMVVDSVAPSVIARIENDLGGRVRNPERVSFVLDHVAPAANVEVATAQQDARRYARERGIRLFDVGRGIYGAVGSATPSAVQAYVAARTTRAERTGALSTLASSFGLGTIVGPALAPLLVLPFVGLSGPVFAFAAIGAVVFAAIWFLLPADAPSAYDARGAAMSYPSLSSPPTGASVLAATSEKPVRRLSFRDPRVFPWLLAGVVAGHAQAAATTPLGFLVIDRLGLPPPQAQPLIGIVMMAGALATLTAQWGLIPRLRLSPRALILWGCALAAAGLAVNALASDLYGITMGFALGSLGFGFIRPGFTAGTSLSVGQSQQGAVAGMITAANGLAFIVAPGLGVWMYSLAPALPYWVAAALTLGLLAWSWRRLKT